MKKRGILILLALLLVCGAGCRAEAPAGTAAEAATAAAKATTAEAATTAKAATAATTAAAETTTAEAATAATTGTETEETEEMTEAAALRMKIGETEVSVAWEDNASVAALRELAGRGPLVIETSPYGGFEQVGEIGAALPRDDVPTATSPGDIMLYVGDRIVVFYGVNSWSYTRLGRIEGLSRDELTALLGGDGVALTLFTGGK